MKKEFKQLTLINILITVVLIPMCLLINLAIEWFPNLLFWFIIAVITFMIINYLLYRIQENDRIRSKDN